jgi:hypothetical protein
VIDLMGRTIRAWSMTASSWAERRTVSEYEPSVLRQRSLAARNSKALRRELHFILPPGCCWNKIGQIEMDSDERLCGGNPASVREVPGTRERPAGPCSGRRIRRYSCRSPGPRMAASSGGPRPTADSEASVLCRRVCIRSHDPAHLGRRRARTQDHRPFKADGGWKVLLRARHPGYS